MTVEPWRAGVAAVELPSRLACVDMNPSQQPLVIKPGDAVPHFQVRAVDGRLTRYVSIWQHRNLALVVLPETAGEGEYADALTARAADFESLNTALVVTRDHLPGIPAPAAIVADKWGEIVHVVAAERVADLPSAEDLLAWLDYVEMRCPECEGEAR